MNVKTAEAKHFHWSRSRSTWTLSASHTVVEPTGSTTLVFCQMAGQEVCAEFKERHDFDPGETIRLMPRLESLHLFDQETGQRLRD